MVGRGGAIRSRELWYFSEGRSVTRLQVLGYLLDIVVIREELVPVLLLLLADDLMVLLGCPSRHFLQIRPGLPRSSLGPGLVSPVRVDASQLRQVSRPPALCVRRWFGPGGKCVDTRVSI